MICNKHRTVIEWMVGTTRPGSIGFEKPWVRAVLKPAPSSAVQAFPLPSLLVLAQVCSFSPTHLYFNPDRQHDVEILSFSLPSHWEEA
jgi:hypothetical protein